MLNLQGNSLREAMDIVKLVLCHFVMCKANDEQLKLIQESIAWYDSQQELVFDVRIETFPELGMRGRLTIEFSPKMEQVQ